MLHSAFRDASASLAAQTPSCKGARVPQALIARGIWKRSAVRLPPELPGAPSPLPPIPPASKDFSASFCGLGQWKRNRQPVILGERGTRRGPLADRDRGATASPLEEC